MGKTHHIPSITVIMHIYIFNINLLIVYRESVNVIGYITRRLFNNYSSSPNGL